MEYVTRDQCEIYRSELSEKNNEQDVVLARYEAEMSFMKKIMFSILGVLVSGFTGTIFAILSIG